MIVSIKSILGLGFTTRVREKGHSEEKHTQVWVQALQGRTVFLFVCVHDLEYSHMSERNLRCYSAPSTLLEAGLFLLAAV